MTSKILIIFFLILLPLCGNARCRNRINPKKIVLFVDLNSSIKEVEAAERGACARGERLVVLPKGSKRAGRANYNLIRAENFDKRYCKRKRTKRCNRNRNDIKKWKEKLRKARSGIRKVNRYTIQRELKAINASGGQITSLVLSGHDGGGKFWGEKRSFLGRIHKRDVFLAFRRYPRLKRALKLMILNGCYTATPKEVFDYNKMFPGLHMIAGHAQKGPSNVRVAGMTYIEDVLKKHKRIVASRNKSQLKQRLSGIRNLLQLNAAMYVKTRANCGSCKKEDYYYRVRPPRGTDRLVNLSTLNCRKSLKKLPRMIASFLKYKLGSLKIPRNTRSSPLRRLYNFVSRNEQCYKSAVRRGLYRRAQLPTKKQLFNLLYYNNIKRSYAAYYKRSHKRIAKLFNGMTIAKLRDRSRHTRASLHNFLSIKKRIWIPNLKNIKYKSRRQILANINDFTRFAKSPFVTSRERATVRRYMRQMNYLIGSQSRPSAIPSSWADFDRRDQDVESPNLPRVRGAIVI